MYTLLTGREQIDFEQFFKPAQNHYDLRGHGMKLTKERSIKTRHKEVLLQSTGGQWLESSSGGSGQCRVCQRLQERLRPQLQERYGRHKKVSLPVHQPTKYTSTQVIVGE